MSTDNYFVMWKGVKTGPFTQKALEIEFIEGRLGLMRTVIHENTSMPARDFVVNIETKRREDDLAELLRDQEDHARQIHERLEQQETDHQLELERISKRSTQGGTLPPPIPDVNPWSPEATNIGSGLPQESVRSSMQDLANSAGREKTLSKYLVAVGYLSAVLAFFLGIYFREAFASIGVLIGIVLIVRKQITQGCIVLIFSLCCYGAGRILAEFVHDYIVKNYPH